MLERKVQHVERERGREQDRADLEAALQRAESDRKTIADRLAQERAAFQRAESERKETADLLAQERTARARAEAEREALRIEGDRIDAEREKVRVERDDWERHFREARTTAVALDAAMNRGREDIDALRRSISWRITAPLRAVYGGVRRILGGR